MGRQPGRFARAIYRGIVGGYPAPDRARFGEDQLQLFEDLARVECPPGLQGARWLLWEYWRAIRSGIALHADRVRRARGRHDGGPAGPAELLHATVTDIRRAARRLRHAPLYALSTAGVIALVMALSTAVIAVVDGVLFKALPYRESDAVVFVGGAGRDALDADRPLAAGELADWRAAAPDVMFAAATTARGLGTLGVVNGPTVWSFSVDRDLLELLGVRPLFGGLVAADFAAPESVPPALISHRLWQRLFAGDPAAVGRTADFSGVRVRVAGVLPRDFVYPARASRTYPDVLLPLILPPGDRDNRTSRFLTVVARLGPGVSPEALASRLVAAGLAAAAQYPPGKEPLPGVTVTRVNDRLAANERRAFRVVLGALGALLLLAAVNVAGLVASRNADRRADTALRLALGASAVVLARGVFAEVLVIVAAGTASGVILAQPLLAATVRLLPDNLLLLREPVADWRVLTLVASAAAIVAVAVTLFSLRRLRAGTITAAIGSGGGAPSPRVQTWGRRALIAIQVALGFVLVIGATFFAGSVWQVWQEDPGFPVERTVHLDALPSGAASDRARKTQAYLDALRRTPGVEAAAALDAPFLERAQRGSPFADPPGALEAATFIEKVGITTGFFPLMNVRLVAGRLLTDQEIESGSDVAVVTEKAASHLWPGRPATGQTLSSRAGSVVIVGVVNDPRFQSLDREPRGVIYTPFFWNNSTGWPVIVVRTTSEHGAGMPALLDAVRRVDPQADIRRARTIEDALAETIRFRRFQAWLFLVLGSAGLAIVGAGVFGLVAMATARRTREVAIRMSLGASGPRVVRQFVREQIGAVLLGIAGGGLISAWAVQLVTSYLYNVPVFDPAVWSVAVLTILGVAVLGALLPSARAARIDPLRALRLE